MTSPVTDDSINPSTKTIGSILSIVLSFVSLILGSSLLSVPSILLQWTIKHDSPTALEFSLARLAGGILLSHVLTSIAILIVSTSRLALSSQASLGVILVLIGLLNDRLDGADDYWMKYLGGCGAMYLVISCIGLIASFCPHKMTSQATMALEVERREPILRPTWWSCCCKRPRIHSTNGDTSAPHDLEEPLLQGNSSDEGEEQPTDDSSLYDDQSRITGTRRLVKLAAPQMYYLYLGCLVLLIRLPFSLSIPHFVSTTIGALSRGDYHQAHTEILLLFILGTMDAVLDYWCVFLFGYAKERIVRGVRVDLLAAILRQDIAFFDRHTSGDLSSRLSSDCGQMAGDLTWFFRFSIESVVRITGIAAYMLIRCPKLGGCALSIVPVVAVVNKLYGDWLRQNAIQVQTALAKANSVAQEAFACVRTVIAFAAEGLEHTKYSERINDHYRLNVRQLMMTGLYYMLVSTFLINTVVQSLLLLIGTALIRHGRLTSEVLLAFMLYQGQLQNETMNLFNSYSSLIKSSGAGDKVFRLLDRIPPPPGTGSYSVEANSESIDQVNEEERSHSSVKLHDIHFVYPSRPGHRVLKGLHLSIPAGSTIALVGASGCGKSTIVALLKRFYDPLGGSILIDGKDLRSIDVLEHRRRIGVVTQDPVLFSGTILSNITYGCPSVTKEVAIEAAKKANAHDFISSFPDGYDTQVGERGIQLSGGQKQRIAIARAIVKNPSLLLLDEATSALDAESESVVQEALDQLLSVNKDMTTVVVAHRLRTVRTADSIAYIQDGQVAEQGAHEDLMRIQGGLYRKMVERAGVSGQLPDD